MSDEIDPEVARDLALRDASERDNTRTRGEGVYDWKPPKPAAMWRCLRERCTGTLDVDQDTIDYLAMWNRELKRRGEPMIRTSEVVLCARCREIGRKNFPGHVARQRARFGELIAQLRQAANPRREVHLHNALVDAGYDDVEALLKAIENRRNGDGKSKRRKGTL